MRANYEAPQAEELVLQYEESFLDSLVQNGGGERISDEDQPGF